MKNIENYETFLDIIMPAIERKFENQKEYLACSKGCSLCCETVNMQFTDTEFEYLMEGYNSLDDDVKNIVKANIETLIKNKGGSCPFLINNVCSAYKYRGIICRTFGLLLISDEGDYNVPFCVHKGLNYAKVFDEDSQKLSADKVKEQGYENDPVFYSLSRSRIFSLQLAKDLGITPKESKTLYEWIEEHETKKIQQI